MVLVSVWVSHCGIYNLGCRSNREKGIQPVVFQGVMLPCWDYISLEKEGRCAHMWVREGDLESPVTGETGALSAVNCCLILILLSGWLLNKMHFMGKSIVLTLFSQHQPNGCFICLPIIIRSWPHRLLPLVRGCISPFGLLFPWLSLSLQWFPGNLVFPLKMYCPKVAVVQFHLINSTSSPFSLLSPVQPPSTQLTYKPWHWTPTRERCTFSLTIPSTGHHWIAQQ